MNIFNKLIIIIILTITNTQVWSSTDGLDSLDNTEDSLDNTEDSLDNTEDSLDNTEDSLDNTSITSITSITRISDRLNKLMIGSSNYSVTLDKVLVDAGNNLGQTTTKSFSSTSFIIGYTRSITKNIYLEFIYSNFSKDTTLATGACSLSSGSSKTIPCKSVLTNIISIVEINGLYFQHINNQFNIFAGIGLAFNTFNQNVSLESTADTKHATNISKKSDSAISLSMQIGVDYAIDTIHHISLIYKYSGNAGKVYSTATNISGFVIAYKYNF